MEIDLYDKIKRQFFQVVAVSVLLYSCTTWALTNTWTKISQELSKNSACYFELILETTPHETAVVWLYTSPITKDEHDMLSTAGEAGMNSSDF